MHRPPVLGRLASGETVVDRPVSHAHIEGGYLRQAFGMIDAGDRDFVIEQVQFHHYIGDAHCVETTAEDEPNITQACRVGRAGLTRFVSGRQPEPTQDITIILLRPEEAGRMVLISAWPGVKAEPEPWDERLKTDPEAKARSEAFWAGHALLYEYFFPEKINFTRTYKLLGQST